MDARAGQARSDSASPRRDCADDGPPVPLMGSERLTFCGDPLKMPPLRVAPRFSLVRRHLLEAEIDMPKMKTKRAASKRLRVTGSGKIRRGSARLSHMMRGKPARRLRKLRKHEIVDASDEKRFKRLLPYAV